MTAGLGASAYIDVATYSRAPTAQETASLLGLNTTLSLGTQPAGTTALQVTASAGWAAGWAWILDGPLSEVVSVVGSVDATHLTLAAPGTVYAHAAGVSVSQAGTAGSLAEVILRASAWVENYCQHGGTGGDRSLFAVARTETWAMPSGRAFIDRDAVVTVLAGHFPVQSVASLSVQFGQGQGLSLDVSQAMVGSSGRLIEVPYLVGAGVGVGQQLWLETVGLSRTHRQWAQLSYTGGVLPGAVPWEIQQAMVWVVSDLLSQRMNPTGAADLQIGKVHRIQRQRGDVVGDSILLLRAHDILQPWMAVRWG